MSSEIQDNVIRHAQRDLGNVPGASHDAPAAQSAGRKIGEGHALGMARLGGHELTNALQAFPDSNISPQEEPGVFGNGNAPQYVPEPEGRSYDEMLERASSRQMTSEPERGITR